MHHIYSRCSALLCGAVWRYLCDRVHEAVRYSAGNVWRERGAEEVKSAKVTSTIAAATAVIAAIAVTAFAALTLSLSLPSFLPTVTHALCSFCVRFWKEELQCGVHL